MPVYNARQTLCRCVDSILSQSFSALELILADDGSCDESGPLCADYARRDRRVRVLRLPHRGVAAAVRQGIAASTGALIAFADSDDWLEPAMLETMVRALERADADFVQCGGWLEEGDCRRALVFDTEKIYEAAEIRTLLVPQLLRFWRTSPPALLPARWNKLFRREALLRALRAAPDGIFYGEDLSLTLPALLEANRGALIRAPLYHYTKKPGPLQPKPGLAENNALLLDALEQALAAHGLPLCLLQDLRCYLLWQELREVFFVRRSFLEDALAVRALSARMAAVSPDWRALLCGAPGGRGETLLLALFGRSAPGAALLGRLRIKRRGSP